MESKILLKDNNLRVEKEGKYFSLTLPYKDIIIGFREDEFSSFLTSIKKIKRRDIDEG